KFETVFLEQRPPTNKCLSELIFWCKKFSELGIAPMHETGSYGNLSARIGKGFIISSAGTDLGNMQKKDFSEVVSVSGNKVRAIGLVEPSSESVLHHAIYSVRPDINAIFHGHDALVVESAEKLGIPITKKEEAYGTQELMGQAKKLFAHDYFVLKNHGIISLGITMKEAGEMAEKMHERAFP
ncbi:MAG: class II aldolase/adducin family protein, partial [Candidatus Aenigmarchaeota archaeon]|nr:class II aldolase/adducin family protein [Candidatus Aenigmarchaeota archaeon]